MTELPWMAEAKKHIGLKEIVGAKHNPKIVEWLKEIPKGQGGRSGENQPDAGRSRQQTGGSRTGEGTPRRRRTGRKANRTGKGKTRCKDCCG